MSDDSLKIGKYSFASRLFVGTGKYTIGERTIFVVRAPLAFQLRDPDYSTGKIGYRLLVPAAVGITDFESIDEIPELDLDDVQTMSVAPGLEVDIPVMQN